AACVISKNSFLKVLKYWANLSDFKGTFIPLCNHLLWVAIPVGHLLVWHIWAWIQPMLIIASLATFIQSTPMANAIAALAGKPNFPLPMNTILWVRSYILNNL